MRPRWLLAICAATAFAAAASVRADTYPTRPIRLIVPYPAGGNPDTVARALAGQLERQVGRSVIVDNRPGASGVIGIDLAAKAAADGYTMLFASSSVVIISALRDKLPYDLQRDLAPVTLLCQGAGFILVTHPALPAQTLPEFIALARNRDKPLTYSSSGLANVSHLMGEMFNHQAKTHLAHVPYKGSAPAFTAVMSGEVQAMFISPTLGVTPIKTGKLRALGFTGATRWKYLPDVPAIVEAVPGFQLDAGWMGWFVPAKTSSSVIHTVHRALAQGINDMRTREFILAGGYEPVGSSPESFQRFLQTELKRFAELARTIKVKLD